MISLSKLGTVWVVMVMEQERHNRFALVGHANFIGRPPK